MKNAILKLVSTLIIALSLSSCSDLKKEITIKTNGGERVTLSIKVPKEFKKDKESYFTIYPLLYMHTWNEGVDESDNPKSEYKFDFNTYAKASLASLQSNIYVIEELEEYFKENEEIVNRIKAEGRVFANKQKE